MVMKDLSATHKLAHFLRRQTLRRNKSYKASQVLLVFLQCNVSYLVPVAQCNASRDALHLPALAGGTTVTLRRQQIASFLGILL